MLFQYLHSLVIRQYEKTQKPGLNILLNTFKHFRTLKIVTE